MNNGYQVKRKYRCLKLKQFIFISKFIQCQFYTSCQSDQIYIFQIKQIKMNPFTQPTFNNKITSSQTHFQPKSYYHHNTNFKKLDPYEYMSQSGTNLRFNTHAPYFNRQKKSRLLNSQMNAKNFNESAYRNNNYQSHPGVIQQSNQELYGQINFNPKSWSNRIQNFDEQILILLKQEESNVRVLKNRIQKQKARVENDFHTFQKQIIHIIADLKTSLKAELDNLYRIFMEKYSYVKTEVQQIVVLKKHIAHNNPQTVQMQPMHGNFISNQQLVKQISKQLFGIKDYQLSKYLTNFQKKKLDPLEDIIKELFGAMAYSGQYYDSNRTYQELNSIKVNFTHLISHFYQNLSQYIKFKPKEDQLANLNQIKSQVIQEQDIQNIYNNNKKIKIGSDESEQSLMMDSNKLHEQYQSHQYQNIYNKYKQSNTEKNIKFKDFESLNYQISNSQQILCSQLNFQELEFKFHSSIKTDHSNRILCAINVNNKLIITGGMDTLLNINTIGGVKIANLKGHDSNICTLALINNQNGTFLASGGDIGCCQVIIWDIKTWSIRAAFKNHSAAVTSILDLQDGETIVSGSFDKKINVYNLKNQKFLYSLQNNKSSIIGMVLTSTKQKMISCGFDNCLYIWGILRNRANNSRYSIVEQIVLQKMIKNPEQILSINNSILNSNLIFLGTKDGKIKFFNTVTSNFDKTIKVNKDPILELLVIQRKDRPYQPMILTCTNKNKSLILVKTEKGISQYLNMDQKVHIQYSCGIGPKMFFMLMNNNTPIVSIVSQDPDRRQINLFEIKALK